MTFEYLNTVVTGGTGVLGSAVVSRLVDAGATCYIPCFDRAELEAFEYRDHDRVQVEEDIDLTNDDIVRTYFTGLPSLWASIHIAGGFAMAAIEETTVEDFTHMMRMNILTSFLCSREAVRSIRESGGDGGRIVNVAARPGIEPRTGAGMIPYATSKAAVAGMTQALAEEVASDGILVNAIVPSIIDTPTNRSDMPNADHDAWPKPAEIAETILFLASPDNYVTRGALVSVFGKS